MKEILMKKGQRNKDEKERGITLIALVITIIVLLILAGVSIAMLTGENGILTQAQVAKEETEKASLIEQVQVDILGEQAKGNGSGISSGVLQTILNKYFTAESVPEDANSITKDTVLTAKNEYGGYDISLSDIYNGDIIAEKEPIETATSYTANYLDINYDGKADGIIYADLAVGGSGQWNNDDWSGYEIPKVDSGLKEYYIEEENYDGEAKFGNAGGKLIAPVEGSSGDPRFYIMALEDINPGTYYCWYDAAYGKLDNIVDTSEDDFGQGKANTADVMAKWDAETWGAQNDNGTYDDLWGAIKEQVEDGWFLPSKSEWAAFGDMATGLGLTTSNYSSYGLKDWYWSSSQSTASNAYDAYFNSGCISGSDVFYINAVRLSATF